ncbi:hypothetical protein TNCT_127491 [Trichonephila clavata]|uniref:EF-hand domain-containing protein n=1 Tax=Trichonephila clavata TaxID=2740835 RepID=A0A8X6GRY2_TRICU|nr:hypothetical protein TNCT_127491 [Trichonephila clavata]
MKSAIVFLQLGHHTFYRPPCDFWLWEYLENQAYHNRNAANRMNYLRLDQNQDGYVTFDEFLECCQKVNWDFFSRQMPMFGVGRERDWLSAVTGHGALMSPLQRGSTELAQSNCSLCASREEELHLIGQVHSQQRASNQLRVF